MPPDGRHVFFKGKVQMITYLRPILTTGGYGAEIQYQGVTVLSNLGNGWGYEMTPAELAKKDEFYSIYWSEYNFVKENGSSELREMPDYLDQDRPSFEARA